MNKKRIVNIIIAVVVIVVMSGVSLGTGIVNDLTEIKQIIVFRPTVIAKIIIMAAFVKAIQWVLQLVLDVISPKKNRAKTAISIIDSLISYVAAVVIICWGFVLLGVNVGTVLASVGIVALIIGFGAESLIEDVITGIFMLFENQYNVDDIVEVDGFCGRVTSIGIRTTVIEDNGQNKKIINNSAMKNILNKSISSSKAVCDIGISYGDDLLTLEKNIPDVLVKIKKENPDLFTGEVKYLGVQELGSSAVILRFIANVSEDRIFDAYRALNRGLLLEFKSLGYEVPYTQVDLHNK